MNDVGTYPSYEHLYLVLHDITATHTYIPPNTNGLSTNAFGLAVPSFGRLRCYYALPKPLPGSEVTSKVHHKIEFSLLIYLLDNCIGFRLR